MTSKEYEKLLNKYLEYAFTEEDINSLDPSFRPAISNQLAEIEQRNKETPFMDLAKTLCASARSECLGREDGTCATKQVKFFLEGYEKICAGENGRYRDSEIYAKCFRLYYIEGKNIEDICAELIDGPHDGPDRRTIYKRLESANTAFARDLYYYLAGLRKWISQ